MSPNPIPRKVYRLALAALIVLACLGSYFRILENYEEGSQTRGINAGNRGGVMAYNKLQNEGFRTSDLCEQSFSV
jgi:hypothetical protein